MIISNIKLIKPVALIFFVSNIYLNGVKLTHEENLSNLALIIKICFILFFN